MSMTGLAALDRTIHKTNEWLNELMDELGTNDKNRAYRALRATLHALRDRIGAHEAAALGAQLPLLLRGVYYEGWKPEVQTKERSLGAFLEHVRQEGLLDLDAEPEVAARAVFKVMSRRMSNGEIEDVKHLLPGALRVLWQKPDAADIATPPQGAFERS
jgi:uncharacterized protein (DUF2267 family)